MPRQGKNNKNAKKDADGFVTVGKKGHNNPRPVIPKPAPKKPAAPLKVEEKAPKPSDHESEFNIKEFNVFILGSNNKKSDLIKKDGGIEGYSSVVIVDRNGIVIAFSTKQGGDECVKKAEENGCASGIINYATFQHIFPNNKVKKVDKLSTLPKLNKPVRSKENVSYLNQNALNRLNRQDEDTEEDEDYYEDEEEYEEDDDDSEAYDEEYDDDDGMSNPIHSNSYDTESSSTYMNNISDDQTDSDEQDDDEQEEEDDGREKLRVTHNYKSYDSRFLTVDEGDIVTVVNHNKKHYVTVEFDGMTGLVTANCLAPLK